MPTTPNRALRYPDSSGTDRIWEHFQNLASDVDSALGPNVAVAWTNIVLAAPWVVSSSITPQARRVGQRIEMRGRAIGGAAGNTLGTLPVPLRPAFQSTLQATINAAPYACALVVNANGTILPYYTTAGAEISLDGTFFSVD